MAPVEGTVRGLVSSRRTSLRGSECKLARKLQWRLMAILAKVARVCEPTPQTISERENCRQLRLLVRWNPSHANATSLPQNISDSIDEAVIASHAWDSLTSERVNYGGERLNL